MYAKADCCHLNHSAQRFNNTHLVKNDRHIDSIDEMNIIFVNESLLDIFLLKMLTMSSPFEKFTRWNHCTHNTTDNIHVPYSY